MMGDFFAMLNEKKIPLEESPVSAENLGKLVELVTSNVINGKTAKDVLQLWRKPGKILRKSLRKRG